MKNGKICWFEFYTNNPTKLKTFYAALFGWTFELLEGYEPEYWTIHTGENSLGGGIALRESVSCETFCTVLYVQVDDMDGCLEKAKSFGATIEKQKTLITTSSGYFALIRDPANNVLGLWSSE